MILRIHCENIDEIDVSIKYIEYGSRKWIFFKNVQEIFLINQKTVFKQDTFWVLSMMCDDFSTIQLKIFFCIIQFIIVTIKFRRILK